jgi:hypothetical protein
MKFIYEIHWNFDIVFNCCQNVDFNLWVVVEEMFFGEMLSLMVACISSQKNVFSWHLCVRGIE